MSARYQLGPILKNMGACDESLAWLAAGKRATFAEAWKACPNKEWIWFLLMMTRGVSFASEVIPIVTDLHTARKSLRHHRITAATVEVWLVEYARANGCLVEVER